jgi:pimeloyl-ACP methyl ester carboxylesterase
MLTVIDKGSCTESHPAPLLFVHGAGLSAWCWDEHFLDFFADNGYRAVAPSLRGHGGSPVSKPFNKCTIADYGRVHWAVHSDVKANFDKYLVELQPPSTTMVCPLMKLPPGEHKNATVLATSSTVPSR